MKSSPTKDPSVPDPRDISLTLAAIVQIFDISDEDAAYEEFEQVILDFYQDSNSPIRDSFFTNINSAFKLLRSLHPQNDHEKVDSATVVLCYLMGTGNMSERSLKNHKLGLRFLEVSSKAMQRLSSKSSNEIKE